MRRIKVFTSACLSFTEESLIFVSPINWMLKLNHVKNARSKNDYFWTQPYFLATADGYNLPDILEEIEEEQIDIIFFSIYVWNKKQFLEIAKYLKQKKPNLIIVAGGPELNAHQDKNFFKTYDFIDWVAYGEGEISTSNLLDFLAGYTMETPINTVNKNGVVGDHVPLNKKDEILKYSIWVEFKDEIGQWLNYIKEKTVGSPLTIVWETTKGCPFACTFCDWSSGLHNKVRVWGEKETIPLWKQELDIFSELQIPTIYWTNPNVGLTPQDTEIVDYAIEKRGAGEHVPFFVHIQISKIKKEKSYALMDKLLENKLSIGVKFDVQDIDLNIIELLDRPEIPWEEHKVLINNLVSKYRNTDSVLDGVPMNMWMGFMWGLPGQTLENFKTNMSEAGSLGLYSLHHPFQLLPNTPAARPDYKEKYGIKSKDVYIHMSDQGGTEVYGSITNQEITNAVVETSALTTKDWFKGVFIYYLYASLQDFIIKNNGRGSMGKEENFVNSCLNSLDNLMNSSYEHFEKSGRVEIFDDEKTYGFRDWTKNRVDELSLFFT